MAVTRLAGCREPELRFITHARYRSPMCGMHGFADVAVQSLAIVASPLHAAAQRFYTDTPSVHGLTLDGTMHPIAHDFRFVTS
jgi:hypothetical protein